MAEVKFTVGNYLAKRLEQIGLQHYFAVPGDYNLMLLDQLLWNKKLQQINTCNELNAAYAADGYARVKGVGALVVTFNVGAFPALGGVAGAYAENLPVIFISGSYNTNDPTENHYLHHTIGTHDLSYQREMISKVTCDAVWLHHANEAPLLIDRAIRSAIRERKPAYIEIPCNLANQPCNEPVPFTSFRPSRASDFEALTTTVEAVSQLINNASKPILLAGAKIRAYGATEAFQELAQALGCGVAVMPDAKSFFPEQHEQFIGIYWGSVSSPGCEAVFREADLIIAAGATYTDYSTVGWTALPEAKKTINAQPGVVAFPDASYTGVELADFLSSLATKVRQNTASLTQYKNDAANENNESSQKAASENKLTRIEMIRQIQGELDGQTTLLVESGDAWFDGMYMQLPQEARFEIEMLWGAIGWSVPATMGYALGVESGRRIVAMIGDGSFRYTAQEVATMISSGISNLTIFLINNTGYLIESAIHEGPYNYYQNWDYAGLMKVLNGGSGHGLGIKATTADELKNAIKQGREHTGGPVLIECLLSHDDYSPKMGEWGKKVSQANSRPPQSIQ